MCTNFRILVELVFILIYVYNISLAHHNNFKQSHQALTDEHQPGFAAEEQDEKKGSEQYVHEQLP